MNNQEFLWKYFKTWVATYKQGAIRDVTMKKYELSLMWLHQLVPHLKLCDINRLTYQELINAYAEDHERVTTMDFHHHVKSAILDAVDEGLIDRDPTRRTIIKGKTPSPKKSKYLNQFELQSLLSHLNLTEAINWDWFILLVAKTGLRFSEALALTPEDFDFSRQTLRVNKTWNYKGNGGFLPTKNHSSVRKVPLDWMTIIQFSQLIKGLPIDRPIFIQSSKKIYNSTVNDLLSRHCKASGITEISIHGLRHTHASLLLFAGVSVASVARRLGHASIHTTQTTYLHVIQELENQDTDIVMRCLSNLS
jgi:integrase